MSKQDNNARVISCYTDASYSKEVGGSVIGYKIGDGEVQTLFLLNVKNTEAEITAVQRCIDTVVNGYDNMLDNNPTNPVNDYEIHIYTDCQRVVQKFEDGEYPYNVEVRKMIGHMKKADKDHNQLIFTQVDRATRKELRKRLKTVRLVNIARSNVVEQENSGDSEVSDNDND
ncbi:hypothetical protein YASMINEVIRUS_527 [Yasminevirus sp. GU-2018]|uniref:Uncharacterized protein n=1 Tax=Yasminevirus sp. GU-2018 TaxID=2420051 RepID=A0A5K0U9A4_9VIRU|nr:hypothetical protein YASMINEVIRUS_527 [Yasminevirus sp. GU-2018]